MRLTAIVQVPAAALAVLLACAGAAHAQVERISDPRDAGESLTDIRAVVLRHGVQNLRVVSRFRELRRDSAAALSIYVDLDPGRTGPELVLGTGLGDGTDYSLSRARGWRSVGAPLDCDYDVGVLWARDRVKARLGQDCLQEADEVAVSVLMEDFADTQGPETDWVPGEKAWSPWVSSG